MNEAESEEELEEMTRLYLWLKGFHDYTQSQFGFAKETMHEVNKLLINLRTKMAISNLH